MKNLMTSVLGLMFTFSIAYIFYAFIEAFVKMAAIAGLQVQPGNIEFVIFVILCATLSAMLFNFLEKRYSTKSTGKATDMELAISALREIQVKASELPNSSQHDAHVIGALAVTVEEILTKEKDSQNA